MILSRGRRFRDEVKRPDKKTDQEGQTSKKRGKPQKDIKKETQGKLVDGSWVRRETLSATVFKR